MINLLLDSIDAVLAWDLPRFDHDACLQAGIELDDDLSLSK